VWNHGARKDGSQLVKRKKWERFTMGNARYARIRLRVGQKE
jgi:hypothetical protein